MAQHIFGQADDPGWDAGVALSEHLAAGHPPLDLPLPGLGVGEVAHVWGHAWLERFFATDVVYEERSFLAFGGFLALAATAAASMIGNQWRRREAFAEAAPQWRWVGPASITVTNQRLIAGDPVTGVSVWLGGAHQVGVDLTHRQIPLYTADGVPTRVRGPWVPLLAVAITHVIDGTTLHIPRRPPAPNQPVSAPPPPPVQRRKTSWGAAIAG